MQQTYVRIHFSLSLSFFLSVFFLHVCNSGFLAMLISVFCFLSVSIISFSVFSYSFFFKPAIHVCGQSMWIDQWLDEWSYGNSNNEPKRLIGLANQSICQTNLWTSISIAFNITTLVWLSLVSLYLSSECVCSSHIDLCWHQHQHGSS